MKKPKPFRVSFVSLGCAKNLVDSEVLLGQIVQNGGVLCAEPDDAEMVVINTCAFIDSAIEESWAAIREALDRKRAGLVKGVVVAGCLAQRFREKVVADAPEVDA
ncbi:MAG: 30S ribosomal protein S12 methylthiotransferase RimO, partial [Planctomycetota bacterium]